MFSENKQNHIRVYNMDCIPGMANLAPESVDLIIADPPFAIDFKAKRSNYNRKDSSVIDGYVEIKPENYKQFTLDWMIQAKRVLKSNGSMYIVSGWTHLNDILTAIESLGLTVVNHIIWQYQFGVYTTRRFVSSHYHILFVTKDDKTRPFFKDRRFQDTKSQYQDMQDVWKIPREYQRSEEKTPTKLPDELVRKMIQYSCPENGTILDPFLGSGTTAVVAKNLGYNMIGFEIVKEYYDYIMKRL